MLDLVIADGTVVAGEMVGSWDIGVSDGRIAAMALPGSLDSLADRLIRVPGKLVVPGAIDPHVHCGWPVHNPKDQSIFLTAGARQVSLAALRGGTTTLVDFVLPQQGEHLQEAMARHETDWSKESFCDFAFHIVLKGEFDAKLLGAVRAAIDDGWASFKVFTTNIRPLIHDRKVDAGDLWELFQVTARHAGIVAVHAEDDELVMHMYRKLIADGRTGYENMPLVHSSLSEDLSFRRVIRLARATDGAALYMMHVSAASGVEAIAEAKDAGQPVFGETLTQYSLKTEEDYLEADGMKYHTYPSLKTRSDVEALWAGVKRGHISTMATDELCTTYEVKVSGRRIDDVVGGNTGVEPRLALVYTEAVERRGFSLPDFARLTSTNAARILGLYPQKGVIAAGSDADLAVLDLRGGRTIRAADLIESDYTPWEGAQVSAWPVMTVLRGRVVANDGEVLSRAGDGRRVPQRLDSAWLAAPR